ncbi:hypothetical protein BABA_02167 [Neobacillus bataviensis LMG 21833]|uniref:Uncharacterized protein n=1 Tax=Neobacillus bataviensis LMG 21833 TaxID=1117379 RepID=K6DSG0_9BACI|nr:hypothetical protein [Neobacillus bataviensis]EKN71299.1 hypothetical protein BABA_02167 [Neobacillus bataviensis LMG 21833]
MNNNYNPLLDIREGVRLQAEERELKLREKQAEIQNQREKEELEKETKANPEPVKKMSAEEMQETITLLSKAIMELTEKMNGKGE